MWIWGFTYICDWKNNQISTHKFLLCVHRHNMEKSYINYEIKYCWKITLKKSLWTLKIDFKNWRDTDNTYSTESWKLLWQSLSILNFCDRIFYFFKKKPILYQELFVSWNTLEQEKTIQNSSLLRSTSYSLPANWNQTRLKFTGN